MIKIGLTGGIGAGKSTVARIMMEHGIPVINADQLSNELVNRDESVRKKIIEHFGDAMYGQDGALDRKKMAAVVFQDARARELLNSIVHPAVIARQEAMLQDLQQTGTDIACVEAALIFEADVTDQFDYIVVVISPLEKVLARLRERDGLSEQEIHARIDSQLPMRKKAEMADYVIENDGSLENLYNKTIALIEWLKIRIDAN